MGQKMIEVTNRAFGTSANTEGPSSQEFSLMGVLLAKGPQIIDRVNEVSTNRYTPYQQSLMTNGILARVLAKKLQIPLQSDTPDNPVEHMQVHLGIQKAKKISHHVTQVEHTSFLAYHAADGNIRIIDTRDALANPSNPIAIRGRITPDEFVDFTKTQLGILIAAPFSFDTEAIGDYQQYLINSGQAKTKRDEKAGIAKPLQEDTALMPRYVTSLSREIIEQPFAQTMQQLLKEFIPGWEIDASYAQQVQREVMLREIEIAQINKRKSSPLFNITKAPLLGHILENTFVVYKPTIKETPVLITLTNEGELLATDKDGRIAPANPDQIIVFRRGLRKGNDKNILIFHEERLLPKVYKTMEQAAAS